MNIPHTIRLFAKYLQIQQDVLQHIKTLVIALFSKRLIVAIWTVIYVHLVSIVLKFLEFVSPMSKRLMFKKRAI